MDSSKIPVLGKVKRTVNALMINFVLLAIIAIGLGIIIPFYPQVLDVMIAALLIVAGLIFLSIAWHIHTTKKKYFEWLD